MSTDWTERDFEGEKEFDPNTYTSSKPKPKPE